MATLTLSDLILELGTWINTSPAIIERAKASKVNVNNNNKFKTLAKAWVNGKYDEDINSLYNQLINLIPQYSLKCKYYKKQFFTLGDLINDILISGMDPNYPITLGGKPTGEIAIDLINI